MIKRLLLLLIAQAMVLGVSQVRADSRWGTMVWNQDNWFIDTDGDGIDDSADVCPNDLLKWDNSGQCGCGVAETDSDGDGVADCLDNCLNSPNPGQADANSDGVGDVCDFASDSDNDGVSDGQEVINTTNPLVSDNGSFNPTGEFHSGLFLDPSVIADGNQLTMRQSLSFNGTVAGTYTVIASSGSGLGQTGGVRLLPNPDHTFSVADTDFTGITSNDQSLDVLADVVGGDNKLALQINGRKGGGMGDTALLGDYVLSQLMDAAAAQAAPSISTSRTLLSFDGAGTVDYATLANSTGANDTGSDVYTVQADGALSMAGGSGFVSPDGELIMTVDTTLDADPQVDDEISLAVGVRRGSNLNVADLLGEFIYYEMGYELHTWTARAVYTFNGAGAGTVEITDDSDGQTAALADFSYTVDGGGNVTVDGRLLGVVSANGEYLVFADTDWADGNPGLSLGVGVKTALVLPPVIIPDQLGFFRVGTWFLDKNDNGQWNAGVDETSIFGTTAGDKPVVGDWNGDGKTERGIYRNGTWLLDLNGNGIWDGTPTDKQCKLGLATDIPVVGDWTGTGVDKIGLFRKGTWLLDMNGNGVWNAGVDRQTKLGLATDIPVVGDWTGSGVDRIGVFRQSTWYLDLNGNGVWNAGVDRQLKFGMATDIPVAGDWTGTGVDMVGLYRQGSWYLDMNGNGIWNSGVDRLMGKFGLTSDKPVVGKW